MVWKLFQGVWHGFHDFCTEELWVDCASCEDQQPWNSYLTLLLLVTTSFAANGSAVLILVWRLLYIHDEGSQCGGLPMVQPKTPQARAPLDFIWRHGYEWWNRPWE